MKNYLLKTTFSSLINPRSLLFQIFILVVVPAAFAQQPSTICQDQSICEGEVVELYCSCGAINFDGTGVVNNNGLWYFDSNISGPGIFEIIANCDGQIPDFFITVVSSPIALINGATTSSTSICQGQSVNLTATGGTSYSWYPSAGLSNSTISNPVATPSVTTTYTVTVSNSVGCTSQASITIVVIPVPILNLNISENPICLGETISGTVTGGVSGYWYSITMAPGNQGNNSQFGGFNFSPNATGNYTISATINNYPCPVINDTEVVSVVDPAIVAATVEDSPICEGQFTWLNVVSDDPTATFVWTPSNSLNTNIGASVLASPSVNTTYTVTATNAGGCISTDEVTVEVTEQCCIANLPPPTYLIDANTPDWIGVNYTLDQDLIISQGVDFYIDNCTLKFAPGKGIKVLMEADLWIINNSLLTTIDNCPGFWAGIFALHPSVYANNVNQTIIRINNSEIEKASPGLSINTLYTVGVVPSSPWMNFQVNYSTFQNCHNDLIVSNPVYDGTKTFVIGNLVSTTFLIDNDYQLGYTPGSVRISIKNNSKAIPFRDCNVKNLNPQFLLGFEFTGLEFVNSPVEFKSFQPNVQGVNSPSSISGFTRGIISSSTANSSYNIRVSGTDFENWRSIYSRSRGSHEVVDGDFYCLRASLTSQNIFINGTSHYLMQENGDISVAPYGLYFDGALGQFGVYDNYFSTNVQLPGANQLWAHGFIANNTGDRPNRLRRNVFENMARAVKLQGDNRNDERSDGLRYSCNDFHNNFSDIREVNSNVGNVNTYGQPHQYSLNSLGEFIDPKNTFTQQGNSCNTCGFDDLSNSTTSNQGNHRYYRLSGSQNPSDLETTPPPKIQFLTATEGDECLDTSEFASDSLGQRIISLNDEINANRNLVQLIKDGGQTEILLSAIESVTYSSALQVYYDLLAQSPDLSEEVLLEALNKFDLPNALVAHILGSNPISAKSGKILDEVENRIIPFDEFQKLQISEALAIFSDLDYLYAEIGALSSRRSELIKYYIVANDSSQSLLTDLYPLLDIEHDPSDLQLYLELLVNKGFLSEAITLSDLSQNMEMYYDQKVEFDYYKQILIVEGCILESSANTPLTSQQITTLEGIIQSGNAWTSSRALNLLIAQNEYSYTEPILDGNEERSVLIPAFSKSQPSFQLYPNPTSGMTTLNFNTTFGDKIRIIDPFGKIIQEIRVMENQKSLVVDLNELPASTYLGCLMGSADDVIHSEILVKL